MDEKRCSTCHEWRPPTDFNRRQTSPDGLQARCRSRARAWYEVNRVEHKRNVAARNLRVRREYQRRIGEHLRLNPCVECGETDVRVLEFDHDVGTKKLADVTVLMGSAGSWKAVLDEIATCSVRCSNCHRRVTAERARSWRRVFAEGVAGAHHAAALSRLGAILP